MTNGDSVENREYYDQLAYECNRIKEQLLMMPQEAADQWVEDVLRWFTDIVKEMQEEISTAHGKIAMIKKMKEIEKKYRPIIEQRKAEIIVALTYAIKPRYQAELAPLMYFILGLV